MQEARQVPPELPKPEPQVKAAMEVDKQTAEEEETPIEVFAVVLPRVFCFPMSRMRVTKFLLKN